MRTKKVNRYYCDFCKKAGCSKWHLQRHEDRCTMNPARDCGVCGLTGEWTPTDLPEMMALLPDPAEYMQAADYGTGEEISPTIRPVIAEAMKKILAISECPACRLAAIRQRGIPVYMVDGFDFNAEMKAVFAGVNSEQQQHVY